MLSLADQTLFPIMSNVVPSAIMTKKSTNNEEQAADRIKPAGDARLGLHLIPSIETKTRISVPAGESLRELLDSFKRPFDSQRQSSDDELPPAA